MLGDDGFMVDHGGGEPIWDVLVDVARVTSLAIMPIGCPSVTDPRPGRSPARGMADDVRVVDSGADLLAMLQAT